MSASRGEAWLVIETDASESSGLAAGISLIPRERGKRRGKIFVGICRRHLARWENTSVKRISARLRNPKLLGSKRSLPGVRRQQICIF